ncbi:MAG: DUF11 domain-containing protein [Planctomycetaceae bacterium]|nr:DUF11 domain-containing protein [Planctomycetaceae bacterium]
MNATDSIADVWPQWWRWTVIALATLSLCSCKAPGIISRPVPAVSLDGSTGGGAMPVGGPALASDCAPCGGQACAPCGPVGRDAIPKGEYVCDGGDKNVGVAVAPNWQLYNLDPQDTIAHFDTLDGRTHVEASNKVCIYAPRFGAVRVVTGPTISDQIDRVEGMLAPHKAIGLDKAELAASSLQRDPLGDHTAAMLPEAYHTRQFDGVISRQLGPKGFQDQFMAYEGVLKLVGNELDASEKARLSQCVDAALIWTADQAVQVIIDGKQAKAVVSEQKVQATYTVEDRREPKLRVTKIANTDNAKPGEIVEFTIRYDNIGTAPLGNIVLVDHLVSRLEYVADSAQSSRDANFSNTTDGATLVMRWEINEHLEAGEGGLVRFKCRVR